jgi:hypothetical protein
MSEIGKITKSMVMEYYNIKIKINTKDNGKMIKSTAMEYLLLMKEVNTQAYGLMINCKHSDKI